MEIKAKKLIGPCQKENDKNTKLKENSKFPDPRSISQINTKSGSICCMVEGDSAEKFSSLRSDDCQDFFVKALIPVPFASGERRFQMIKPRYAIEFFI